MILLKKFGNTLCPTFLHPPASLPIPSSSSDFDIITSPKPITGPPPKTYATVMTTPVNEQVENIKKVYSEKIAKLDRNLSQEVKKHLDEERQMKIVITHLVKKKEQLEAKLAKSAPLAKPTPLTSKPPTTNKNTVSFSPTLKNQAQPTQLMLNIT
jgi:hypothetical protein